jgi:23S rRNA (guanosine2251-2'-O)-methyltransferase
LRETLYGRHAVREALLAGRRQLYSLVLADTIRPNVVVQDIVARADRAGLVVERLPARELDRLEGGNHQGVLLEVGGYPYVTLDALLTHARECQSPPLLLLLDLISDPQNLGSLLRTADAVGVHGIVIQERRATGITPAVVRSSSGAVEHLRVAQVTNLARTIDDLRDRDVWAAGLEDSPEAILYDKANLRGALGLVVGSEGRGLRRLVRERCDFLVRLPMSGRVSSLNAAVAGSIVLYEASRQRRARGQ